MWKARRSLPNLLLLALALPVVLLESCRSPQVKPVDIFPEDNCALCRMAVSDHTFASEIITADGEVLKFDDLSCLEAYREARTGLKIAAVFVKDYETKTWLPMERSVVIETGLHTPMGSGMIAVRDSLRAREILQRFPPQSAR